MMIGSLRYPLFLLIAAAVAGCAPRIPQGMKEAQELAAEMAPAGKQGGVQAEEYRSFKRSVRAAEKLLKAGKEEEAEQTFLLAWMKGELLKRNLQMSKAGPLERARLRSEIEELEKQRLQQAEAAQRKKSEELEQTQPKKLEKPPKAPREKPLPSFHAVRRGETLPQVASHPEVYGDAALWPLLYRANRDQIRDPRRISAGQVLRIPRNVSREEMNEARRFAQDRPIN